MDNSKSWFQLTWLGILALLISCIAAAIAESISIPVFPIISGGKFEFEFFSYNLIVPFLLLPSMVLYIIFCKAVATTYKRELAFWLPVGPVVLFSILAFLSDLFRLVNDGAGIGFLIGPMIVFPTIVTYLFLRISCGTKHQVARVESTGNE